LIFHRILFFVNKKPDLWSGLYTIAFVDSLFYQCQKTSNPTCYPQATTKIDMLCLFSLQGKFIIFFVVCKKTFLNKNMDYLLPLLFSCSLKHYQRSENQQGKFSFSCVCLQDFVS